MDLSNYTRVSIDKVTAPPNWLVMAYRDYFRIVTPENEILRYRKASWQCSTSREICERLKPEGCFVRHIPMVFIKCGAEEFYYDQ